MGFILLIGVMLFLIVATIMGVRSSRKMYKENHPNKNRPFALFFSIALLSGLVYVFGAKKMELSIDLTLSWMLFTMYSFFVQELYFLVVFL